MWGVCEIVAGRNEQIADGIWWTVDSPAGCVFYLQNYQMGSVIVDSE